MKTKQKAKDRKETQEKESCCGTGGCSGGCCDGEAKGVTVWCCCKITKE